MNSLGSQLVDILKVRKLGKGEECKMGDKN